MRDARRVTYAAFCAAISVLAMAASVFLPLSIFPVLVAALCFFIAFECALPYGFLSAAAALLSAVFLFGGGVINSTFVFTAFLAVPYAFMAVFIKRLDYSQPKRALMRAIATGLFFNVFFAVIVFGLAPLLTYFLFGLDVDVIFAFLGGRLTGYVILAATGTILMVLFDYTFIMAYRVLDSRLKFIRTRLKNDEDMEEGKENEEREQ